MIKNGCYVNLFHFQGEGPGVTVKLGSLYIPQSQTSILSSSQRSGEKRVKQIRILNPLLILRKPFSWL